jgi:hypothetical protein
MQRKTSADFALMAKKSAGRGSKNYVHLTMHDDRNCYPARNFQWDDNPFRAWRGWQRWRWLIHDIRVFGSWETLRKNHYLQAVWHKKSEKIYHGRDENGNTYWSTNDGMRIQGGRWIEPVDPHWFRGSDAYTCPPDWFGWLTGNFAHTPAEMQARGELGLNGRCGGTTHPWHLEYVPGMFLLGAGLDPTFVPQTTVVFSPWYKQMKEAGFSRWVNNIGRPLTLPFMGEHDVKDEVVEEFYRGQAAYQRWSRGHDHDEWKNG